MCYHGKAGESESKESLHLLALNKVAKLDFLAHGTSLLVSDLKNFGTIIMRPLTPERVSI